MARRPMRPRPVPRGTGWEAVSVPTRLLITLESHHSAFRSPQEAFGRSQRWEGAIVRLRPPPGADMALVEALKDKLLTSGAVRVRIETQRGSTLPIEAIEKPTPATRSSARQVITQLVEETNTTDREALKSLVEKLMNEEGL